MFQSAMNFLVLIIVRSAPCTSRALKFYIKFIGLAWSVA